MTATCTGVMMRGKNANRVTQPFELLLADPLIQLVMTADRVDADDLRMMLEDIAQRRRNMPSIRPMAIPGNVSIATTGDAAYRRGVGMIVMNGSGQILVGQRIDDSGRDIALARWQMPQGGIDPGEMPRNAALRELREEIGTDNVEIVAESNAWFQYDLPDQLRPRSWGTRWRGQQQKWFVMRFLGTDAEIDVATEHPEFTTWQWIDPDAITDLVVNFKRDLYRRVMLDFADAIAAE